MSRSPKRVTFGKEFGAHFTDKLTAARTIPALARRTFVPRGDPHLRG